jgi:hypothetical protein
VRLHSREEEKKSMLAKESGKREEDQQGRSPHLLNQGCKNGRPGGKKGKVEIATRGSGIA